ncbi:MAG: TatD family hydrolase, partial [Rhodanobacteraceae bacterium]
MHLIDIGANLTHESFRHDFDAVLERARTAGVEQVIVTGASCAGSEQALALARAHPGTLYATAGVHPHHAGDYGAEADALLRGLAREPQVVAIGETGLDYFRDLSPRAAQRAAFEKQLALAIDLAMPLFLHQRDAHDDFLRLLKAARDDVPGVVVHCFTD